MDKQVLFLIVAFGVLGATGYYAHQNIEKVEAAQALEVTFLSQKVEKQMRILPDKNLALLLGIEKFSAFSELGKRNLFSKFKPQKVEIAKPVMKEVKKPVVKPIEIPKVEEPEPVIEVPQVVYRYRGKMMLDDREAYIVEREEPYKTFFLKENDDRSDLEIIEIGRFGISIKDRNTNEIFNLALNKE